MQNKIRVKLLYMWTDSREVGSSDYESYIKQMDIKDWEEISEDKYYSLLQLLAKKPTQYGEKILLLREPKTQPSQEISLPKCLDELYEQKKKNEEKRKKEEKNYKEKKHIAKEKRDLKAYQKLQEKFQNPLVKNREI